ncbi:MAG: ABC transporter permease [Lachnospiraceae bacterium]|nr:ABC transporter permease [Lachnospiraceae bacterium]
MVQVPDLPEKVVKERKKTLKKEQLKQYWFVIKELTGRELKRKYSRSYLGVLWSVLNPLLSMAVMSAIFSMMFQRSIENFPIYYLTGSIIWSLFTGATNAAMTSLVDNKQLLIKVKLPMQVFTLSRVYTSLANFGYSFVAYVVFLFIFKIPLNWTMLVLIPIVALTLLFATGLSLFLASAYVFFGDIKHLYGILLTLWMYISALFYPVTALSETMQAVVRENPMYCYIAAARECMMYGKLPDAGLWIRMIVWAVVIFTFGQLFFQSKKNNIMQKV